MADKYGLETTSELRRFLLDQMKGVASGDVDLNRAKVVCNISQQVYNTIRLEMMAVKLGAEVEKDGTASTRSINI